MKVAHLAEAFGMDCKVTAMAQPTSPSDAAIKNCRWYERGLLHPFLD